MIVYLAAFKTLNNYYNESTKDIYLLSSFFEHRNGRYGDYVCQEKHILDSGAFTAINDRSGKYKNFDWDNYCRKYIEFINSTKQKLFFELDIDCVVGLKKVEYYRKLIEDRTGIAPIVCWHENRGKEYWIESCEKYPYVAVGTTNAAKQGRLFRQNPLYLKWFIEIAHKNNAKIHGLGYTNTKLLNKLHFDSVDSTTWLSGGRFGLIYRFENGSMESTSPPENMRVKDYKQADVHNFKQWIRFQKYAEKYL